jgi:hypothetical protein
MLSVIATWVALVATAVVVFIIMHDLLTGDE